MSNFGNGKPISLNRNDMWEKSGLFQTAIWRHFPFLFFLIKINTSKNIATF